MLFVILSGAAVWGYFVVSSASSGDGQFAVARQNSPDKKQDNKATQSSRPSTPQNLEGLQVQGTSTSGLLGQLHQDQPASAPAPTLPPPSEFKQYEEYIGGQASLYVDEAIGDGQEAVLGSRVAVLYKGWLTDGQLFDQTRVNEQGQLQPFVFELGSGQVISGWDQGVTGMKVGGKRRLIISPAFGYGPTGQGSIPPDAMLIFDVELVAVEG